jgi:hypothetical protein
MLDCRVGNMALFEHLSARTTAAQWCALARLRGLPDEAIRRDIFTGAAETEADPSPASPPPREASPAGDWLGGRGRNWTLG